MNQREFMLSRMETIRKSRAVSSIDQDRIRQLMNQVEIYIPCLECESLGSQHYCHKFKTTMEPGMLSLGCGEGVIDIPF